MHRLHAAIVASAHPTDVSTHDRRQQGALVREVLVKRADGNAGPVGNLDRRGLIESAGEQNLNGCFENSVDGCRANVAAAAFSWGPARRFDSVSYANSPALQICARYPACAHFEYRFHLALTLVGLLLSGQSLACEPPIGFVNPPRPDIAPLEELLGHTEQIDIARSLAAVIQAGSRPLSEGIRPTRRPARRQRHFQSDGARLWHGGCAQTRLPHRWHPSPSKRCCTVKRTARASDFRYVVWNYTSPEL